MAVSFSLENLSGYSKTSSILVWNGGSPSLTGSAGVSNSVTTLGSLAGAGKFDVSISGASVDAVYISGSSNDDWSVAATGKGNVESLRGITLGNGANTVSLDGAVGDTNGVAIELGNGGNKVSLVGALVNKATFGSGADTFFASLVGGQIDMGGGNDTVSVTAVNTGSTIALGDGDNSLVGSLADGKVQITAGKGTDKVSVAGADGGVYTVDLGDGTNTFDAADLAGASFTYAGGSGADSVKALGAGALNVTLGKGNDTLIASLTGAVNVDGGDGDDHVSLSGAFGDTATTGTIDLGNGKNVLEGASLGAVTINLGNGNDSIKFASISGATINLGGGVDTVSLSGDTGVTVDASGSSRSAISLSGASATVTGGSGADTLFVDSLISGEAVLGDGNNVVSLTSADSDSKLTFGEGKDSLVVKDTANLLTIDLGAGNDTVRVASLTGGTLDLGAGNDDASLGAIKGSAISLGDGKDTLLVAGGFDSATITGGSGADVISLGTTTAGSDTVAVKQFTYGEDVVYAPGINEKSFKSDGTFSITGGSVQMDAVNGAYFVTAGTKTDAVSSYVWTGESGAQVDLGSFSDAFTILGTSNDDAVDTLLGSQGNDTIYAGKGDLVNGGAGNDSISLMKDDGVTELVGFNSGKDTVANFATGFETDADVVVLSNNAFADLGKVTTTNGGVIAALGSGDTLTVNDSTATAKTVNILVQDNTGTRQKLAVVNETDAVTDVASLASVYLRAANATKAELDFTSVEDSLTIDLGNTGIVEDNTTFSGKFEQVKGGKGDSNILLGSAANAETLTAGTGTTTLWGGGASNDVLDGTSATSAVTTYFFNAGDGKDTIKGGSWGASDTNDVLYLLNGVQSWTKDSTKLVLNVSDSDALTVANPGSAVAEIKFTTDKQNFYAMAIGNTNSNNTFTYSTDVQLYYGGSKTDTLTVGSDIDNAKLWLAGSPGLLASSIEKIDATASSGNLELVGSAAGNETIVGGKGKNTLWGAEGDDVLTGGTENIFYYGKKDGNDVITGSGSDDKVMLYDISSNDLTADCMTVANGTATLKVGESTLTIKNFTTAASVTTFETTDAVWKYTSDGWSLQSMK